MKDKLKAELLEKVKPGMKPSDLKKKNPIPQPPKDEGYESDQSNQSIPKAPPLPNQKLLDQISSLKKQLQIYQDFKEADLKIKEKYKETISQLKQSNDDLIKTVEYLRNQLTALGNQNNKPEINEPKEVKTFLCSECQQTKPHSELSRVFGKFSFCLDCSKKARQTATQQKSKPQPQEFICHLCNKPKTEIPVKMKLDSTLQEYLICQECKPLAKEFNEADLITDEL